MNYVIDENENLVSIDIQEIAFNAAHPVGEIYIQFPGKEDPQTLYGRGTWDNISNEFAGLFTITLSITIYYIINSKGIKKWLSVLVEIVQFDRWCSIRIWGVWRVVGAWGDAIGWRVDDGV